MWKLNISELEKRGINKVGQSGYLLYGEQSIDGVLLRYTFDLIRGKILFSLNQEVVAYIYLYAEGPKLIIRESKLISSAIGSELQDILVCFYELLSEDFETDYTYSNDIALKFRYNMLHRITTGEINPLELESSLDKSERVVNYCNIRYGHGTEYIIRSGQGIEVCNTDIIIPWERVKSALIKMVNNFTDTKHPYPMNFKYLRGIPSKEEGLIVVAFYTLLNEEFSSRITLEEIFDDSYTKEELSEYLKSNWPIGNYLYNKSIGTVQFNTDINTNSYIGKNRCNLRNKNYPNKIMCQPVYDPYSTHTKIVSLFTTSNTGISICTPNGEAVHSYDWDEIAHVLYENDLWRTGRRLLEVVSLEDTLEENLETSTEEVIPSILNEFSLKDNSIDATEDYVENYMELFAGANCLDHSAEGYLDKSDYEDVEDYIPNYMDLFTIEPTHTDSLMSTPKEDDIEDINSNVIESDTSNLEDLISEIHIEASQTSTPDYSVLKGGQLSLF